MSISLLRDSNLKYFPIGLHTLDYDNNNQIIDKKNNERTSDFVSRLSSTRSDKRFCCTGNSCNLKIFHDNDPLIYQRILLPRIIENGSIIFNIQNDNNKPILSFENQKFTLNKIQFFQDTLFQWNQNQDINPNIRNKYLHDGELHLHLSRLNPGKPNNIIIVIGIKNNTISGRNILTNSFTDISNPNAVNLHEILPPKLSFFTYDMNNNNTQIIIMEYFLEMSNFNDIVRILNDNNSILPDDINNILVRPLDITKKAMYGFLKVNEKKRTGDYENKVYFENEKRIKYNPNIIETNKVKSIQDKLLFTLKIPPNFKLVRKDDIGPLQSFLHKKVFLPVYFSIVILTLIGLFAFGIHKRNFWNISLFLISFWIFLSGGFLMSLLIGRNYYNKKKNGIPINDPNKEEKEMNLDNILSNISKPGQFIAIIFGLILLLIIIITITGFVLEIPNPFNNIEEIEL